jgi:signal transduction histidine kinase
MEAGPPRRRARGRARARPTASASEPRAQALELRLIVDASFCIDDVAVLGPGRRSELRPLCGRLVVELFHPEDREPLSAVLREAKEEGAAAELTVTSRLAGRADECRVVVTPGERFIHVTLVLEADEARGELEPGAPVGGVSHELKNLLAATLVNAELLRRDAGDVQTVHEIADEILGATEQACALLEQLAG